MGSFVDSPMAGSDFQKDGNIPDGSPGMYDGNGGCPIFAEYPRTKGGVGVKEKFFDRAVPNPDGEPDQF